MKTTDKVLLGFGAVLLAAISLFVYIILAKPELLADSNVTSEPLPQAVVTYDEENGFVPNEIAVSVGESVIFKNNRASQPMYVATDPHPAHSDYPEFETMIALAGAYPEIGQDFTFTFKKPGRWWYHDHADPDMTGVIVVR